MAKSLKGLLSIFGIISIVIFALFVIGGFIKGFTYTFALLPGWVWTILFLGSVGFYMIWDEERAKESKKAFDEAFETKKEKEKRSIEIEALRDKQLNIDHSKEVFYKSAVTIAAVNKSLVQPMLKPDGTIKKDKDGNLLGSVKLMQVYIYNNEGDRIREERISFIAGPISELNNRLETNNLKAGSAVPGNIIYVEGLTPMWQGQEPKKNIRNNEVLKVLLRNKEYPVYAKYVYTEALDQVDKFVNDEDLHAIDSPQNPIANLPF